MSKRRIVLLCLQSNADVSHPVLGNLSPCSSVTLGLRPTNSLHILQSDLICAESEHAPASESCGKVFLQIGIESGGAVVAIEQHHWRKPNHD